MHSPLRKLERSFSTMVMTTNILYFFEKPLEKHHSQNMYLSVHYFSPFVEEPVLTDSPTRHTKQTQYNSCTQYYHCKKFACLGAFKEMKELLSLNSPEEVYDRSKVLEKKYIGSEKWKEWEECKVDVMRKAVRLKFEQNPGLMQKLLMTGNKTLVEDHPKDAFWGGTLPDSKNVLGQLLMELRGNVLKQRKIVPLAAGEGEYYDAGYMTGKEVIGTGLDENYQESLKEIEAKKQYDNVNTATLSTSGTEKQTWLSEQDLALQLENQIATIPPLMYLTEGDRKTLIAESQICCLLKGKWIVEINNKKDRGNCFLIIEGEAHVFGPNKVFLELIKEGTLFGVDGPLFGRRFYSIITATKLTLLQIPQATFERMLVKDTVFTLSIARNLMLKHNIFESLNSFKSFVRQCRLSHVIDREELISRYKQIESCLHPHCNSSDIDIDGWLYAVRRLPANITSTFIYHISTKAPDMLSHPDISLPVRTSARPRTILRIIEGKCVVILRDLETDLLDFVSNLCVHIVESGKVIEKLNSPLILKDLMEARADQSSVVALLATSSLSLEEVAGLEKIWPTGLGDHLSNILLHYNDFYIKISEPLSHLKQDPIEKWITRLWLSVLKLLGLSPNTNSSSIPDSDMVVDLIQGSRRAFLNLVTPYTYIHRKEIMEWAERKQPKLVTKTFLCEEDKLYAYAHYYYLNHTDAMKMKSELEDENGVVKIEQSELTGVMVTLVDCNKLKPENCDPALAPKPKAKYHLIINIGYTFGIQSSDIIRSLMNVFGKKLHSVNIIGKAGGLVGSKGDLLLATRIYSDESMEVVNNNLGDLNPMDLEKCAGRPVHVGPMLTVAGTIIQNSILLNYYKKLYHCVGLEMEGLPFAREIKRFKEFGLIREDIVSRFAYYISDLPLMPTETLSKEEGEINFDEGVPSLNAIYRHFTQKLFV